MEREVIKSERDWASMAYSLAVRAGNLLFVSGQTGVNPASREIEEGVESQTRQALTNLKRALQIAGSSLEQVVKVTVYLTNMDDFAKMNQVYRAFFPKDPPARTTVGVLRLANEKMLIEVDAVATI